jgi:haloalkane dehalogenase
VNWREYQALQKVSVLGDRFISYVAQGEGDPIVLLHGMPTWGYVWYGLMVDLAQTHRVLVPDMLGFGFSDKRDCFDRSIARQAEMIDLWLDSIGVQRAMIVGHDIGGGVALRLATLFPERVSRLCLLNTVSYDSWPIEAMLQLGHPGARRRLPASSLVALLKLALRQGFDHTPNGDFVDGLVAPYSTEVGKESLIRCASALNTNQTMDIAPLLMKLQVPTLIVWGVEDRYQPVRYAERLAWDIPGARLVRVKDAKHFVMVDQTDSVVREIRGFMMREGKPRPVEERERSARV